jgi:signal transduction histidine kinase
MTPNPTPAELSAFETFHGVPESQLQWFIDQSIVKEYAEGESLFSPDEPMNFTHIIMRGKIRVLFVQAGQQREVYTLEPGDITGNLPYSRATSARATGLVSEKALVVSFPKEKYHELICNNHDLTTRFVQEMTSRVREFTQLQQQNEKMMALGKLSAGLAHELNNPAAAIVRSSESLKNHLQLLPRTFKDVIAIRMTDEQVDLVNNRLFEKLKSFDRSGNTLSLMERASCEDDLTDWFDDHGIENALEIAENFVEFGFNEDDFDFFVEHIPEKDLQPVIHWINNNLVTEKMVADIHDAAERIGKLVASVKNFTHMDRSPDKQLADLHSGIRNTLTMLNHKVKKSKIEYKEDFDVNIPPVKILVSELNQVWTNLIDNALDALENNEKPRLTIKTRAENGFIKVHIIDNGPGIPKDIQSKIFDPFFTTKEMGKGTGLGLDVVNRIVAQHNGKVTLNSGPGNTDFEVCIPING